MKRIIRLTESDLSRIVRRVIREQEEITDPCQDLVDKLSKMMKGREIPSSCLASDTQGDCIMEVALLLKDFDNPIVLFGRVTNAIDELRACREESDEEMY